MSHRLSRQTRRECRVQGGISGVQLALFVIKVLPKYLGVTVLDKSYEIKTPMTFHHLCTLDNNGNWQLGVVNNANNANIQHTYWKTPMKLLDLGALLACDAVRKQKANLISRVNWITESMVKRMIPQERREGHTTYFLLHLFYNCANFCKQQFQKTWNFTYFLRLWSLESETEECM